MLADLKIGLWLGISTFENASHLLDNNRPLSLYRQFFYSRRFFGRVGVDKWTVNVSRFMFFGYQRVRGMICWIAEKSMIDEL